MTKRSRTINRAGWFLAATILVTLATVGFAAPSAQAFTWSGHGSYGTVQVPVAHLGFTDISGTFESLRVPPRVIGESPAYRSQDQYVCITHRTWELGGSGWYLRDSVRNCGWIAAAQTSIQDNGYTSRYTPVIGTPLGYDVLVTWQLRNGTKIADEQIDYQVGNGYTRDLQCVNYPSVHCTVYPQGALAVK